jgi:hypothetical protein
MGIKGCILWELLETKIPPSTGWVQDEKILIYQGLPQQGKCKKQMTDYLCCMPLSFVMHWLRGIKGCSLQEQLGGEKPPSPDWTSNRPINKIFGTCLTAKI